MGICQIKPISQSFTMFLDTILQYFQLSFPFEKKKKDTKIETNGLQNN